MPLFIPVPLQSLPHGELSKEQKVDPSLRGLLKQVSPMDNLNDSSRGYSILHDFLVRKWVPHVDYILGKAVIQIVVPLKFRDLVSNTSHDDIAGHLRVRKTCARIPGCFFLASFKTGRF